MMQAFLGSLKLDDQSGDWDEVSEEEVEVEFPSSLPSGGVEAEYAYGGETLKWGINSGGSIAWKSSDTRKAIQDEYKEVAKNPDKGFHFHTGRTLATIVGYKNEWFEGVSESLNVEITG